ncbi:ATP phosphoribosyltransferase regulatory subunit [Arcobacter sp. FWKO B]|uniref:ATP phosphoribosyltransferase regulatory subunit n=1 Tax=Arcobacter sp. FWKO B TaxID=2593672 RepID=UPI0018A3C143|nr:ATP phosphoribosyltransferase regulatory subunit [Arcobacter sp. FWKO B]QOG12364.1 ATP phosphoribosyltransferase regulatory subunit [Arcobacter sp. FWKO B]
MIFEHEIPKGARLYFGKLARQKRELESSLSEMLLKNGFEEIVTPNFSYGQHQSIDDVKKLIKFFDEENNEVALRADSTLDVVRIITKRLGRTTSHKKWFYVQPVFSYPSNEHYQIGCEWIGHDDISDIISLSLDVVKRLNINATLQISNINIPKIISEDFGIDIELFKNNDVSTLYALNIDWLNKLIEIDSKDDITQSLLNSMPESIKAEVEKLKNIAMFQMYDNIVISPLYYGSMKYYDDIYYRIVDGNHTIMIGGSYKSEEIDSLGFALYTDNVLKILDN